MAREQLYASFLLDKQEGLEIALVAESVTEATVVASNIRKLPTTVDFLEGIMHLRDTAIPLINLKKRLGLPDISYNTEAKVAVVQGYDQKYGLLFDDIKEVFRADSSAIYPISVGLQTEDKIVSSLIQLDEGRRTIELLDLNHIFATDAELEGVQAHMEVPVEEEVITYSRFVIFKCNEQTYGVPVELAQEITFLSNVDDRYQEDFIDGALKLRGSTIPVVGASYLLTGVHRGLHRADEDYRILVIELEDCSFGMVVEDVQEILNVPDKKILPIPMANKKIRGVYERGESDNIILLSIEDVISNQIEKFRAMFRLNEYSIAADGDEGTPQSLHHLITENGYLVFSVQKHFGMEIKDVQEILENYDLLRTPGEEGAQVGVVNLRGQIVPVVSLRRFLGYNDKEAGTESSKLIICKGAGKTVALEVDSIVTIYKQEQYHVTPSLNPKWADKKDALDRLIEFLGDEGLREHVLIINIDNLVANYFSFVSDDEVSETNETSESLLTK